MRRVPSACHIIFPFKRGLAIVHNHIRCCECPAGDRAFSSWAPSKNEAFFTSRRHLSSPVRHHTVYRNPQSGGVRYGSTRHSSRFDLRRCGCLTAKRILRLMTRTWGGASAHRADLEEYKLLPIPMAQPRIILPLTDSQASI